MQACTGPSPNRELPLLARHARPARPKVTHPVARVLQPVVEPLLLDVRGHPVRLLMVGQQLQGAWYPGAVASSSVTLH